MSAFGHLRDHGLHETMDRRFNNPAPIVLIQCTCGDVSTGATMNAAIDAFGTHMWTAALDKAMEILRSHGVLS